MKQDHLAHHHRYGYFARHMTPPLPLRKFSLRPEEPEDSVFFQLAIASIIAGFLLLCIWEFYQ
jgi:hypothetical protein